MVFLLSTLVVLAGDFLSKFLIRSYLYPTQSVPVVPDVFHITYQLNPGAAFGLLPYRTGFFVGISVVIIVILVLYVSRLRSTAARCGMGAMTGGAAGNLVDRLRTGYVVDFLDFRFWPVFNLADAAIVIGLVLFVWSVIRWPGSEASAEEGLGPCRR